MLIIKNLLQRKLFFIYTSDYNPLYYYLKPGKSKNWGFGGFWGFVQDHET